MTAMIEQSIMIEKIIIFWNKKIFNVMIFSSEVYCSLFQIVNKTIYLFYSIISFNFMFSTDNFHINIKDLIRLTIILSLSKIRLISEHCFNELYNIENSYFKLLQTMSSSSLYRSFIKIFNVFLIINSA